MKKHLLISIFIIAIASIGYAQTSLSLQINHKLSGNEFAFNETGTNNLDQDFNADRLEYYLSQISIVHDGGTYTMLQDYAIIDAGTEAILNFGDVEASTIEAISFFVGVGEQDNHSDPASWSSPHPLAPRFPAMHWGWAAGFRFLAIEGKELGSNQTVQIHALGDGNYFETLIPVNIEVSGSELQINIDANYEKIYEDISIAGGLILHSEGGACITALENMRDHVFTLSDNVLSTPEIATNFSVNAFPNPSTNGLVTIEFNSEEAGNFDITVFDILGKVVMTKSNIASSANLDLQLPNTGLYLLNLSVDGQSFHTEKLISQ